MLLFVGALGFVSCEKETREEVKGTGRVNPFEFGELHNKYLLEAMELSTLNKRLSTKQSFMSVNIPNVSNRIKENIIDTISSMTLEQMKHITLKHLQSKQAIVYYNKIDFVLDNFYNYNYLSAELDKIAIDINNNLVEEDWDIVMVYLETIRASANIWTPKEDGGLGIGHEYAMSNLVSKKYSINQLQAWVKADGRGAGYGMVLWSFSAFLGPVGGAGLLYGAVSGAIFSSLDVI